MKRIIIVTGASSGLGIEFARQLSQVRTADEIWLLARRKDNLEKVAENLFPGYIEKPETNVKTAKILPRIVPMDIEGNTGVRRFSELLEKEKRNGDFVIDTLVNNAGFGTYGTFMETALDRQLEMIGLNVYSLTGLCHASIPFMQRGSLLINVASLAGYIPLGNFAVYGATKAYVLSFSTALAAEIADSGIFVSTVCPGPVDTEFANVASNGARKKVVDGKSPAKVVTHCLRTIQRGRRFAIMAPKWKFKAFMSRFVGRFAFARYSFVHEKRPSK